MINKSLISIVLVSVAGCASTEQPSTNDSYMSGMCKQYINGELDNDRLGDDVKKTLEDTCN